MAGKFKVFPDAQAWLEYYAVPVPEAGCWLFEKAVNRQGYGHVAWQGGLKRANRASYEMFYGPIPEGLFVCHRCDVPACINPKHLFLGTNLENMHDMIRKGRDRKVRKTHCIRGHALTRRSYDSHGECRICLNDAAAKYKRRIRVRDWVNSMVGL